MKTIAQLTVENERLRTALQAGVLILDGIFAAARDLQILAEKWTAGVADLGGDAGADPGDTRPIVIDKSDDNGNN